MSWKIHQNPDANEAWKKRLEWITTSQSYRDFDGIDGEPTEFEWNIFPGFDMLQLYGKVKDLLSRLGETPEKFPGGILFFMLMFNDFSCGTKDNEKECVANALVVSIFAKRFGIGQWSLNCPGSEKKWSFMEENSCWNSPKAHVQFSVPRHHCPEVNPKAKDMENCRFTLLPLRNIETFSLNCFCESAQS